MFYLYRFISDFYSKQYSREINKKGCTTMALILNQKRSYWYAKMLHTQGQVFLGFGE